MRRISISLIFVLVVHVSLFQFHTKKEILDVYPDKVVSGNSFSIQFDPISKTAKILSYGSAKTLMLMGDKTGTYNYPIEKNGSVGYYDLVYQFISNSLLNIVLSSGEKTIAKATFEKIDNSEFSYKLHVSQYANCSVGGIGPSGGIIIYDKGQYSNGWRFIEAAPADLRVINGSPTIDASDPWYDFGEDEFIFGFYRQNPKGKALYINGTTKYDENTCTRINDTGYRNTALLVTAMGERVNIVFEDEITESTTLYAAKLCNDLVYEDFDDWFLPSLALLPYLFNNYLSNNDVSLGESPSDTYKWWSSSESNEAVNDAYGLIINTKYGVRVDSYQNIGRDVKCRIRPVRYF